MGTLWIIVISNVVIVGAFVTWTLYQISKNYHPLAKLISETSDFSLLKSLAKDYPSWREEILARVNLLVIAETNYEQPWILLSEMLSSLEFFSGVLNVEESRTLILNHIEEKIKKIEPVEKSLGIIETIWKDCPKFRGFIPNKLLAEIFEKMSLERIDSWLKGVNYIRLNDYSERVIEQKFKEYSLDGLIDFYNSASGEIKGLLDEFLAKEFKDSSLKEVSGVFTQTRSPALKELFETKLRVVLLDQAKSLLAESEENFEVKGLNLNLGLKS